MKQEDKDLLLRDLCNRLPYGVIIEHDGNLSKVDTIFMCDSISISSTSMDKEFFYNLNLDEVKPYLFPLSSITEEIMDEIYNNTGVYDIDSFVHIEVGTTFEDLTKIFDILHKHHIDYRGLIPMGLAIDATGLNIY